VLKAGRLQQVGTPDELYRTPANVFVAGFIGSPAMNLARGRLVDTGGGFAIELGGQSMPIPPEVVLARPALRDLAGREVVIGLRPSAFALAVAESSGTRLEITAVTVEALGDEKNVLFQPPFALPDTAELTPMWTARVSPDAAVKAGQNVSLEVDLHEAYFFDPTTGLAIPHSERILCDTVSQR
jgi:multiple sugar transport system ATP-binding protein